MEKQTYIKSVCDLDDRNTRCLLGSHLEQGAIGIDEALIVAELHTRGAAANSRLIGAKFNIEPALMHGIVQNLLKLGWIRIVEKADT